MRGITAPLTENEEALIQSGNARNLYIETYGCAMNLADSEVVASILGSNGFVTTDDPLKADVVFINTCSIRDNAEQRIWGRLSEMKHQKKKNPSMIVGVLGCMAERLKSDLLEKSKLVDIVAGPDAYRDLPKLIEQVETGQKAVNVLLSREETYAGITPVRLGSNGVSGFISIMRGCDNMCSFCVVPFTRGRERSRDPESILAEANELYQNGYKEITLLGQNVDSYHHGDVNFAKLLTAVAQIGNDLRIRFSSSHPKDITDEVLFAMQKHTNICHSIHFPLQSGNDRILHKMNRTYDSAWFKMRLDRIRELIPDCGITTDVITGFCSETEEEHQDTLAMFTYAKFDFAYMYQYSERPGTLAARRYADDVPEETKNRRLQEIIDLQAENSFKNNQTFVGKECLVLVEGPSKRNEQEWMGRNDQNHVVVFPKENVEKGQYVIIQIDRATRTTLFGKMVRVHTF